MSTRPIVVHVDDPRGWDRYIGRTVPSRGLAASVYANPFRVGPDGSRAEVLAKYRQHLRDHPEIVERARREIKPGDRIACWCKDPMRSWQTALPFYVHLDKEKDCHGDIVADIVEGQDP